MTLTASALTRKYHATLASAYQAIDQHQITLLSLDVFDTLLFRRKCAQPSDIFLYQHDLLIAKNLISPVISAIEWRELRIKAEDQARKAADNRAKEVSLIEIYSYLPASLVPKALQNQLILCELSIEKSLIEVDPYIAELIRYAAEKDISYIAVSDTYFTATQLEDIIHTAFGKCEYSIPKPVHFFVSCELKDTKSLTLFSHVLNKMACPPTQVLHVGDNLDADVTGAESFQIKALHYASNYPWLAEIEDLESKIHPEATAKFHSPFGGLCHHLRRKIAMSFDHHEKIPYYKTYGAFVYGPLFYGYALWCLQKAKSLGLTKLFCFTREAHLFVPLLQELAAYYYPIAVHPIPISRPFARLITLEQLDINSLMTLFYLHSPHELLRSVEQVTGEYVLEKLGLPCDNNKFIKKKEKVMNSDIPKLLARILSDPSCFQAITVFIQQQKQAFREHLQSIGFMDDSSAGVCDLGWSGTTQGLLRQFLNQEQITVNMVGLYLGTRQAMLSMLSEKDMAFGYLIQFGEPNPFAKAIFRTPELIENMTMPAHGSFKQFDHQQPLFHEPVLPSTQLIELAEIQAGILSFAQTINVYFHKNITECFTHQDDIAHHSMINLRLLVRSFISPGTFEVNLFQHWAHECNHGVSKAQLLIPNQTWLKQHINTIPLANLLCGQNLQEIYWLAGALAFMGRNSLGCLFTRVELNQIPANILPHCYVSYKPKHQNPLQINYRKRPPAGAIFRKQGQRIRQWFKRQSPYKNHVILCNNSELFNKDWYLTRYPDVNAGGIDPVIHYLQYGASEGRDPGPYFSTHAYLRENPDISRSGVNPLVHFEHMNNALRQKKNPYSAWVKAYDTLTGMERDTIRSREHCLTYRPLISILLPLKDTDLNWLSTTIESVSRQLYSRWQLCIAADISLETNLKQYLANLAQHDSRIMVIYNKTNNSVSTASNQALQIAEGEFVILFNQHDVFAESALYHVAQALNDHTQLALIYTDEDLLNARGVRKTPYFKSAWNPDLLISHHYLGHLVASRRSLVNSLGGFREAYEGAHAYDLSLRLTEMVMPEQIHHIPHILYHTRILTPLDQCQHKLAERKALQSHFERAGTPGVTVVAHPTLPNYHRAIYTLPDKLPLVSIIIPTKDKVDLLKPCIDSIIQKTDYAPFEVVIIDNNSQEKETHRYFNQLVGHEFIRVIPYPEPFNYSKINNFAVTKTHGDILVFLNNDTKVITSSWLTELVRHAQRPEIGAVGVKLYYPNDTIQHAGVIGGFGALAGHLFCHLPGKSAGYMNKALLTQNFLAVTAACMAMRRSVFDEIQGFDALLAVDFNDVDICLRLYDKGYRILFTPDVELYHYESATRGKPRTPEDKARAQKEIRFMQEKWGALLQNDPFHNPNLSVTCSDCSLAFPPRKRSFINKWTASPHE